MISMACFFIVTIFIILFAAIKKYNDYNYILNHKENEVSNYLETNFDEEMEISDISIKDGCYAVCNPVNNKDFKFAVMYWTSREKYIDTYLQVCLEEEANQLILSKLSNEYSDITCFSQLSTSSPINKFEELHKTYEYLGRPLSWHDEICSETLQDITIIINDDNIDENTAYEIVKMVDELPISYQHIKISKNKLENILVNIYT